MREVYRESSDRKSESRLANAQPRRPLARPFEADPLERRSRRHEPCATSISRAHSQSTPKAKRTFIPDVKVQRLERRRRPSRPLSRRSARREHAEDAYTDLPDDGFALLERDGDESPPVRRPGESRDRSLVPLENVEASRRLEVVDDRCAFVRADCETLGLAVEVDGGVATTRRESATPWERNSSELTFEPARPG